MNDTLPIVMCMCVFPVEFVQVGWGKKETQFHGSEGKQAAQIKPDVSPSRL